MTRTQIIVYDNGFGLTRDTLLLDEALRAGGVTAAVSRVRRDAVGRRVRPVRSAVERWWRGIPARPRDPAPFDLNIMIERIRPLFAPAAPVNALLANPEWVKPCDLEQLHVLDVVFVKTRHAVPLFESLGLRTVHLGFTSSDRLRPDVERRLQFFHLAGRGEERGTAAIFEAWRRHPEWPRLTVVQHPARVEREVTGPNIRHVVRYVDDDTLRVWQNTHVFHLCPAETEGFGHYIVEGLSTGAVVLTIGAAPMNELVTPERGLEIAYSRTGRRGLATTYVADAEGIEAAVRRALALPEAERARLGRNARAWFLENDRQFRARVVPALREALAPA